jgi:adenylosuccinate lyase
MKSLYDAVSPLDFRYYGDDEEVFARLQPYVSESAYIRYQARVECALGLAFSELGWVPEGFAEELTRACDAVSAEEVYAEEKRMGHVVRALVYCIARRMSPQSGRFVHLFATSSDITDTASALRFQELSRDVILPDLLRLTETLIALARRHAATPQIGRTHGQFAEPITFGFAIALYVDRLWGRIEALEAARQRLPGQLSGAVGAYSALSLKLPRAAVLFEKLFLAELGMEPSPGSISSQVVQPEFLTDLGYAAQSAFSVIANLADDMRHLHRSEIGEVRERISSDTVGSSTMPHKVNPKSFENVKSLWKAFAPRMLTMLADQITEHQRDLTNSASARFLPELFTALDYCVVRMERSMAGLTVDEAAMSRNLAASQDQIIAEPLYILLALAGHAEAYDRVRRLAREARERGRRLLDLVNEDAALAPLLRQLAEEQRRLLEDPALYTGQARARTLAVCARRERDVRRLRESLEREPQAVRAMRAERLASLREQIRSIESGRTVPPEDFCPAEDRAALIAAGSHVRRG